MMAQIHSPPDDSLPNNKNDNRYLVREPYSQYGAHDSWQDNISANDNHKENNLNDILLHDNSESFQQRQKLFARDDQELVMANNEAFDALDFQSDDSDPDTIIWHLLTDIPPNLTMLF
jgi:hypothetical protein